MAETSRSHVTITLGRSGQVVKRAGAVFDSAFSDSQPSVGSKRSVRNRLGSNVDAIQLSNKRQREDDDRLSLKAANDINDSHLGKDDLRFKIMKRTQSVGLQNRVDLREMLSRRTRPSTTSLSTHQHMPDSRNGKQQIPDPKDVRQHMPEPRDDRQRMPEPRDVRQRMPEPIEVRQRIPELNDVRHCIPELTNGSIQAQVHSTRSAEALPQIGLLRNSYSPWTLDHIRRRSPDRVVETSRSSSPPRIARGRSPTRIARGRSPPRNGNDGPQRRPISRTYGDLRSAAYVNRDVHELSRPTTSASFMKKPALPAGPANPARLLVAPSLPPAGIRPRNPYTVDEQPTVESFLHSLGLDKYAISFKFEEVDMATLSQMGDNDLKELGIPMGPRKKILLAILSRSRRRVR